MSPRSLKPDFVNFGEEEIREQPTDTGKPTTWCSIARDDVANIMQDMDSERKSLSKKDKLADMDMENSEIIT